MRTIAELIELVNEVDKSVDRIEALCGAAYSKDWWQMEFRALAVQRLTEYGYPQ